MTTSTTTRTAPASADRDRRRSALTTADARGKARVESARPTLAMQRRLVAQLVG